MLFEEDPLNLHYMTDRQQRFDRKMSKLKNSGDKDTYILDALEVS